MGVLQEASAGVSVVLCGLFAPLFCFAYPVFPYPWMLLTPRQTVFLLHSGSALKQASRPSVSVQDMTNSHKIKRAMFCVFLRIRRVT